MAKVIINNFGGNVHCNASNGVQITISGDDKTESHNTTTAFLQYFNNDEQLCAKYVSLMTECKSTTDFARFIVRNIYKDMLQDGRSAEEAQRILSGPDFLNTAAQLLMSYKSGKGLRNMQEALKKYAFSV